MSFTFLKQFFTRERRWFWYRIELVGATEPEINQANSSAADHKNGVLPTLRYTEQRPEWVLLYKHVKKGQIRPEDIRHMHRIDLEYLAGMNTSPPGLKQDESAKLRENVARASAELQRRNELRVGLIGAVVGAVIGAVATILSGLV